MKLVVDIPGHSMIMFCVEGMPQARISMMKSAGTFEVGGNSA